MIIPNMVIYFAMIFSGIISTIFSKCFISWFTLERVLNCEARGGFVLVLFAFFK